MSDLEKDFAGLWIDPADAGEEIDPHITCGYEDEIRAAEWLDHQPGKGYPRPDMPREVAMAEAWHRYMHSTSVPNLKLWRITNSFYHLPDQQVATLFATIFTWLGTNVGSGMVEEANRINRDRFHGFVMRWAVENQRVSYLNHGLGVIDHLVDRLGWMHKDLSSDLIRSTFQLMRFLDQPEGGLLIEYAQEQYLKIRGEPRFRWGI